MVKHIPLILFVVLTNAMSQTLLKQGMVKIGEFNIDASNALSMGFKIAFDPWVISGMLVMLISMAAHLYVLSRVPLTFIAGIVFIGRAGDAIDNQQNTEIAHIEDAEHDL